MTESSARAELDLSVVLPTLNERENLEELIPQLQDSISRLGVRSEIVVVDSCSADGTAAAASRLGATVIERPARYGEALLPGSPRHEAPTSSRWTPTTRTTPP